MKPKSIICPDCFGDGIETCHNPDHGFYGMLSNFVSANESACPCCGHDPNHKIKGKCYTCSGLGEVSKEIYDIYLSEIKNLKEIEIIEEHCLPVED